MRLIDADNLTQKLYMLTEVLGTELVHIDTIVDHIENQPTIDAVEVVRCNDCKWFNPINNGDHGYCGTPYHGREVYEDDYCSDGEMAEQ